MPERPNPIDAVLGAARLYSSNFGVVLPVIALLQAVKGGLVVLLVGELGDPVGGFISFLTSSFLLISIDIVSAWFVVDAHRGDPPRSPAELVDRVFPALPVLAAVGALAALVIARFTAPFGLGIVTQYAVFPAIAVLVVWLDARDIKGDPAGEPSAAIEHALELSRPVMASALGLLVLQLFSVELIPALADSIIGRHAPLLQWVAVESSISTFITPIAVMSIAGFYLRLRGPATAPPAFAPAKSWPQIPGTPPAG